MKYALLAVIIAAGSAGLALDGQTGIHDPSTIAICKGKLYTYGTGGNALVSGDGWTWRRGTPLPRRGLAPDVIHIGDRYYVYVAANIGAQPKAAVNLISTKSLDPDSPDYKWEEGGVVSGTGAERQRASRRRPVAIFPNSRSPCADWFRFMKSISIESHGRSRLNCVWRCRSGLERVRRPLIHIFAGEKCASTR